MFEVVVFIVALLFGTLAINLFNFGLHVSLKKIGASSYGRVIANGWLLGWLFMFPLIFLWSGFVVIAGLGLYYSGYEDGVFLVILFIDLAAFLLTPGVSIASRTFYLYPTLPRRPIIQAAIGWTVPYPVLLAIALWCWGLFMRDSELSKALYGQRTIVVILVAAFFLLICRFIGIEIMALTSAGKMWMPDSGDHAYDKTEEPSRESVPVKANTLWATMGRAKTTTGDVAAHPFSKPVIGWGIAWVGFVLLTVSQIGSYNGLFNSSSLFYTPRSIIITALLVSAGAAGVAALLMRKSTTSWHRSVKDAEIWFLSGLWGWLIAAPLGYIYFRLYIRLFSSLNKFIKLHRLLWPLEQTALWSAGFLALIIGYYIARRKFLKQTDAQQ